MKQFNKLIIFTGIIGIFIMALTTGILSGFNNKEKDKLYNVEVNRLYNSIKNGVPIQDLPISTTEYITKIDYISEKADKQALEDFFKGSGIQTGMNFQVLPLDEKATGAGFVRFSIKNTDNKEDLPLIITINGILFFMILFLEGILIYIKMKILKPFNEIKELPLELSKGNFSVELKETKNKYFGSFIWGLSMLRTCLLAQKEDNLQLEKNKKLLIASLSHDIKTPVASIKLYSKALQEELYPDENKKKDCAHLIEKKADEIDSIVQDIIKTSTEELAQCKVENGEFYLKALMEKLEQNHKEKLALQKIDFSVLGFANILLCGDEYRVLEVLGNIIENAVKYGNGGYIKISSFKEDYRYLIKVENSGVALAQNEINHIFSSFWRGSNSKGKPGNGLGLYFSKQLMKAMEGDIFAEAFPGGIALTIVLRYI